MSLQSTVEASIRAYAATRRLGAAVEEQWAAWPPDDAAALLDLAGALRLGGNHLSDLMTWLEEISARDGTSPASILRTPAVRGILATSLGRSDKVKRVRTWIRSLRYPRLTALERALAEEVQALGLGPDITVRFPPGLEGDEVTVEVRARRPAALRAAVDRLAKAVGDGGFDRVFRHLDESF